MATVRWNKAKHIENFGETLCGRTIPSRGKEWNALGIATCKSCLKAEQKAEEQAEYDERHLIGQCPFNPKKTFTVTPVNMNEFVVNQFIDGAWQSDATADLYRTSEMSYLDQSELKELAKR
jgi:hypothetical protein